MILDDEPFNLFGVGSEVASNEPTTTSGFAYEVGQQFQLPGAVYRTIVLVEVLHCTWR